MKLETGKTRVVFGSFAKQLRNASLCSPVSSCVRMQQRNSHWRDFLCNFLFPCY
jgi:hypothetical protein